MNVIALAKWVPNPAGTPEMGPDNRLKREGAEGALDPGDEPSIEQALRLVEQGEGEVTVVSMGPEVATEAIRKALSMGCHKGVHVVDDTLRGADVLVTSRVLAAAIKRQEFDLVLTAVESTDGYTGTLPQTLAELLGVPSLSFAKKVELSDGKLRVERQTETGYEVVECELPAVVAVTAGATEPRYPTLKGIMQAKQKPLEKLSVSDLGLSGDDAKPSQEVAGLEAAPERGAGEVVEDADEATQKIVSILKEAKVI